MWETASPTQSHSEAAYNQRGFGIVIRYIVLRMLEVLWLADAL